MKYWHLNLNEIQEMIGFCRQYKNILIFGVSENCEYILKFFDICNVRVNAFVENNLPEHKFCYREIPVITTDKLIKQFSTVDTGIILGLYNEHYESVIPYLRKCDFSYFDVSEHNKNIIMSKLSPKPPKETHIEIPITEHCNLNCKMCNYFAPLAKKQFYPLTNFRNDIKRLANLCEHKLGTLKIIGGEPLLHPNLIEILRISRETFQDNEIILVTNGTLLLHHENAKQGNIWDALKKFNIWILLTVYPININVNAIFDKANEYGVNIGIIPNLPNPDSEKKLHKFVLDPLGKQEAFTFINCGYFNSCVTMMQGGKIFPCPPAAHIHIFNEFFNENLMITEDDYVDIYKIKSFSDISDLCSRRVEFCKYCAIKSHGRWYKWEVSNKTIDEWIDIAGEESST